MRGGRGGGGQGKGEIRLRQRWGGDRGVVRIDGAFSVQAPTRLLQCPDSGSTYGPVPSKGAAHLQHAHVVGVAQDAAPDLVVLHRFPAREEAHSTGEQARQRNGAGYHWEESAGEQPTDAASYGQRSSQFSAPPMEMDAWAVSTLLVPKNFLRRRYASLNRGKDSSYWQHRKERFEWGHHHERTTSLENTPVRQQGVCVCGVAVTF